jgi:surface antigen
MYKVLIKLTGVIVLGAGLSACSSMYSHEQPSAKATAAETNEEKPIELSGAPVADTAPLAGSIEGSMDANDHNKLSRALDGGIGKETHWVSGSTGIAYTVVPTRKINVGGNNLCRKYTITATRGGSKQEVSGSACVASDGAWHTV